MKYFVSVWVPGMLIPIGKITVKSKDVSRIPRLKAGELLELTLTAGGEAEARFKSKREGRRLHVAVVSCAGGVTVKVNADGKEVTRVTGRDALHLAVGRTPPGTLIVNVSPLPPSPESYRVLVAAAHSPRRLPLPRLPKKLSIDLKDLSCTSIVVSWMKAPGGPSYCIVIKRVKKEETVLERPPFQCGWEQTLKRPADNEEVICVRESKDKWQSLYINTLYPVTDYVINVIIIHPTTGRALSLTPKIFKTPHCTLPP